MYKVLPATTTLKRGRAGSIPAIYFGRPVVCRPCSRAGDTSNPACTKWGFDLSHWPEYWVLDKECGALTRLSAVLSRANKISGSLG